MYSDREQVEAAYEELLSGDIEAAEFIAIASYWDGDLAEIL